MPVTIVADAGSASANSFVTLAETTTYLEARLNTTTWDAASTDTQNRSLVEATREISRMMFKGNRSTTSQALAWPRSWVDDPDPAWPGYSWLDDSTVPQRVKDATMELAFQFVNAGTSDISVADPNQGLVAKTVDVLSWQWDSYRKPTGLARYPRVKELLAPLLCSSGASVPLIRG